MIELFKKHLSDYFLDDKEFWTALGDYIQHRKEIKSPLTKIAVTRLSNKLNKYSSGICTDALDRSIINGWTGVYPESEIDKRGLQKGEPDDPMMLLDVLHKRYGMFKMPGFQGLKTSPLTQFYNRLVKPSLNVVNDTEKNITGGLFTMYANLCVDDELDLQFGVVYIMDYYLNWIGDNRWIDAPAESLFDTEGKLFTKFVRYYSIGFNNRRNILTGKYIY